MRITLIILLLAMSLDLHSSAASSLPEQLLLLVGRWHMERNGAQIFEEWQQKSATRLEGRSWMVKDAKEIELEQLVIEAEADGVYYKPTVHDQNNGEQVRFKLEASDQSTFVFSNADHDFPQHISYSLVSQDSVVALVYGKVKGQEKSIRFAYSRQR